MQCTRPIWLSDYDMFVPCGKCGHCRRQRSIEWSTRLMHEALYHEKSAFLTLTYDDAHVPSEGVSKDELQRFFKRLRKRLDGWRLKYYACGEYGEKRKRPHYHAIVFGLSADEVGEVEACWPSGFVQAGSVTVRSTRYVAGYIQKALYGSWPKGCGEPFSLMSKGLGLDYVRDHAEQITRNLGETIDGVPVGLPKYYRKKLAIPTEVLYAKSLEGLEPILEHYREKYGDDVQGREAALLAFKAHRAQSERNLEARESLRKLKKRGSL